MNAPECGLYLVGDVGLLRPRPRVSIVGTRKPSKEGLSRASRLARDLVGQGVVVVSGLARGIDTAAHAATIDLGGRTIAVLGTPLDASYPRENAALQRRTPRSTCSSPSSLPATPPAAPTSPVATGRWPS